MRRSARSARGSGCGRSRPRCKFSRSRLSNRHGGRMAKLPSLRVAVIGAGPIGIEAALYAKACGSQVTVYDRGPIGEHVRRWGHVRMFTPFGMNSTALGLAEVRREKA